MGVVYQAWDPRLQRVVALKTVLMPSGSALRRFRREAQAQAKLRHRNVVPVHVIDEHDGVTFLVMDYVEGTTVSELLQSAGRLTEARALQIARAVVAALAAAHERGLVHRDVKPSNVLLDTKGDVLLADFGLARTMDDLAPGAGAVTSSTEWPRTVGVVGTPAYLSPEQVRGEPADHRSDMYALGVTLYELVTGKRPPPARADDPARAPARPSDLVKATSSAVDELCARLLAPSPDDRFATYRELAAAIDEAELAATRPAPLFRRAVAFSIDFVVLTLLGACVRLVAIWLIVRSSLAAESEAQRAMTPMAWVVAAVIGAALEASVGTTLGKRLLSLRVATLPGVQAKTARMVARNLLKFGPAILSVWAVEVWPRPLPGMLFVFGYVSDAAACLGTGHASLHDRWTKTRVLCDERAR